jgi:aryl-alcohol dehydrogenase-like predicted oxidoreductase
MTHSNIGRYTYGTTRLGDESIPFPDRVKMARAAMDTGVWFHTSHDYGDTFRVLRAAFDEDRAHVPNSIFKIGGGTEEEMMAIVEKSLTLLGIEQLGIMQVCLWGQARESALTGGALAQTMLGLKTRGVIGGYVVEVWPWTSDEHVDTARTVATPGLFDGYIYYFNPMQRFVTNELFDLLLERKVPIYALRTLGGGSPTREGVGQESVPVPWSRRVAEIVPIFERSGVASWTEFCCRFIFGWPDVVTTIGATSRPESLHEMIQHSASPAPLPTDIQEEIAACQRAWAPLDKDATPWSM